MTAKKSPSAEGFEDKPFEGQVFRTDPGSEKVTVNSATGYDEVVVPHPMLGPNSWIRGMPERGARVLTQASAGGTLRRVIVGYTSRASAEFISRYRAGKGVYKQLKPGEWDMMTPGIASIHGTVDGKLFLRGGLVHATLDPKRLHARFRAPTHRRELHLNDDTEVYDEERFGVVVRNKSTTKKHRWLREPNGGTGFAKEYLRLFGRDDQRLALVMEGDCYDDDGKPLKQDDTNKLLRMVREYYDSSGDVISQTQLDDEGSILHNGEASDIKINQDGADTLMKLLQLAVKLGQSLDVKADTSVNIQAQTTGRYGGSTQTILGPDPMPIDACIKGTIFHTSIITPLLQQLNTHATALSNIFQEMAKPAAQGGSIPDGNVQGTKLKPFYTQISTDLRVLGAGMVVLNGLLMATLSQNVKVSL